MKTSTNIGASNFVDGQGTRGRRIRKKKTRQGVFEGFAVLGQSHMTHKTVKNGCRK